MIMATIAPKPGFDWSRVRWDAAHDFVRMDCSYCGYVIDEEVDPAPLRMWNHRCDSAVFCDACAERWWGLQPFGDEP
jgi:hypothetical protein